MSGTTAPIPAMPKQLSGPSPLGQTSRNAGAIVPEIGGPPGQVGGHQHRSTGPGEYDRGPDLGHAPVSGLPPMMTGGRPPYAAQPHPTGLAAYGAAMGPTSAATAPMRPTGPMGPMGPMGSMEGITTDADADAGYVEEEDDDADMGGGSMADYPQSAYNYGTWTAADDRTLLAARGRGQHWADLQRTYFPSKTANACRKRYERLMERRGVYDYDARKLERIAKEYMGMRKQIWSGLAARVGEKWPAVEAQCMSAGLRTIQSNARSHTNRWRRESRISLKARETEGEGAHRPGSGPGPGPVPGPGLGPVTTLGLISPVEEEFFGTSSSGGDNNTGGAAPIPGSRSRSSVEIMPPPYLPASATLASPTRALPMSGVPFGGYLNGKSTRPMAPRGLTSMANPETLPSASGDPGWQSPGPRGGYPGPSHHHPGWGGDGSGGRGDEAGRSSSR